MGHFSPGHVGHWSNHSKPDDLVCILKIPTADSKQDSEYIIMLPDPILRVVFID